MQLVSESVLQDIMEQYRDFKLENEDIRGGMEDVNPFQNVFLQECESMNTLLQEIVRSLRELDMGFRGDLTMSDAMEALQLQLFLNAVPSSWARLAYPSQRSLSQWLQNLAARITQLQEWTANPMELPRSTWISGLFNPAAFLTAIMQSAARESGSELDKLITATEVTKKTFNELDGPAREGVYIHGLSLEGARWDFNNTLLETSKPKEMMCPMPVINCKAVDRDRAEKANVYHCPVYKTQQRGPTFVFTANLRTKAPAARWVMAGVVLIMDVV